MPAYSIRPEIRAGLTRGRALRGAAAAALVAALRRALTPQRSSRARVPSATRRSTAG